MENTKENYLEIGESEAEKVVRKLATRLRIALKEEYKETKIDFIFLTKDLKIRVFKNPIKYSSELKIFGKDGKPFSGEAVLVKATYIDKAHSAYITPQCFNYFISRDEELENLTVSHSYNQVYFG